jgi:hypothetical protein
MSWSCRTHAWLGGVVEAEGTLRDLRKRA